MIPESNHWIRLPNGSIFSFYGYPLNHTLTKYTAILISVKRKIKNSCNSYLQQLTHHPTSSMQAVTSVKNSAFQFFKSRFGDKAAKIPGQSAQTLVFLTPSRPFRFATASAGYAWRISATIRCGRLRFLAA